MQYAPEFIDFEKDSAYQLTLAAVDAGGLITQSTASITVQDMNDAPILLASACSVAEHSPASTRVCVIDAEDVDANLAGAIRFSLTDDGTQGAQSFAIESSTGLITVSNNQFLDFETVQELTVEVCVEDRGTPIRSACRPYKIAIDDVNERPQVIPNQVCTVDETSFAATAADIQSRTDTVVCTLVSTDVDEHSSVTAWKTHRWSATDVTSSNPLYVDEDGRVRISSPRQLDFEGGTTKYLLKARVTDGGNLASDDVLIEIRVQDINEPPVVTASDFTVN